MKILKFFGFFCLNSIINKIPFFYLRYIFYKYIFNVSLDKSSSLLRNVTILDPRRIVIGKNSIINWNVLLDGRGSKIIIGNNVDIAPEVNIWTLQHDPDSETHEVLSNKVIINDYCWIGNRSIILPGVELAEGTVIAAGSVVTKSTDSYCLYGGVPAKKIRKLTLNQKKMNLDYKPWFM
jgi:acetyltransferase-like isoleucine patch superfamily enzyme